MIFSIFLHRKLTEKKAGVNPVRMNEALAPPFLPLRSFAAFVVIRVIRLPKKGLDKSKREAIIWGV
jgi:hypothetical protein